MSFLESCVGCVSISSLSRMLDIFVGAALRGRPLVPIQAPRKLTEGVATEGRPYNWSEPAAFRTSVIDAEVFPYLFDGPTLPKPINVFSGGK